MPTGGGTSGKDGAQAVPRPAIPAAVTRSPYVSLAKLVPQVRLCYQGPECVPAAVRVNLLTRHRGFVLVSAGAPKSLSALQSLESRALLVPGPGSKQEEQWFSQASLYQTPKAGAGGLPNPGEGPSYPTPCSYDKEELLLHRPRRSSCLLGGCFFVFSSTLIHKKVLGKWKNSVYLTCWVDWQCFSLSFSVSASLCLSHTLQGNDSKHLRNHIQNSAPGTVLLTRQEMTH